MPANPSVTRTGAMSWLRRHAPLALVGLVALAVRLPGLDRPLVGNFATKNVVYAMIARNWVLGRADFWHPTLDVLRDGQRSWHLVEVPLSAYLTGALWHGVGGSLDVWGRVTAVIWSLVSVVLIHRLALGWFGRRAALAAAATMAISPVSVIYGQSFMLEPSVVALSLAAILCVERWRRGNLWFGLLATFTLACLLLSKLYMLALFLPLAAIVLRPSSDHRDRRPWMWLARFAFMFAVAALPAFAWWVMVGTDTQPGTPDAGRVFYSIRDSVRDHGWPHPLLVSSNFYAGILRDLGTVVLTPVGLVLAAAGLTQRRWRRIAPWLISCVVMLVLLPRKFHEMNYYYLVVLPALALLIGLGWRQLGRHIRIRRAWQLGFAAVTLGICLRFAWKPAFQTPFEDRGVVPAAATLIENGFGDRPVVTMHGTTIDLVYYCGTTGWALSPEAPELAASLEQCQRQGARHLVVANVRRAMDAPRTREVLRQWPIVAAGDDFQIYDLSAGPRLAESERERR